VASMEPIEERVDQSRDVQELFLDVTLPNTEEGSVEEAELTSIVESGSSGSLLASLAGIWRGRTRGTHCDCCSL
jgi:hypothetical protein